MKATNRIAKNSLFLLVAKVVSMGLGFFYLMYSARYLGAEKFGILSFALAFTAIFAIFMDIGMVTLTTRNVAKDKSQADKYIRNVIPIKLVLVVITSIIIVLAINLLGYPEQTIKLVYIITLSIIFTTLSGTFKSIFQAFEKMEYISLADIISSFLMLAGAIVCIKQAFDVIAFAYVYLIVNAIILIYSFVICAWKFVFPRIEIDFDFWKEVIKEAWPMGGMAVCIMIYFRIDTVMLSLMMNDDAVGIYTAAYRVSEISTILPSIIVASVFPTLSYCDKNSNNLFLLIYKKSVKYLLYLALPMAVAITLLSKYIINIIYGSDFSSSANALQILIWASAIMYLTMIQGSTIVAVNKQMFSLKVTIVSCILNIVMNLILIPKYSYIGASMATLATEAFGLFVGLFFLNKWGYKLNIGSILLPPLFALGTAGIFSYILVIMQTNIFIVSLVFLLIYAIITYYLGVEEDDKQIMKNMICVPKLTFNFSK